MSNVFNYTITVNSNATGVLPVLEKHLFANLSVKKIIGISFVEHELYKLKRIKTN
jgi:hypothetical protein